MTCREVLWNIRIACRRPRTNINAVQNSAQNALTAAEDVIHALTEVLCLQLTSIRWAHGEQIIRVAKRTLHKVDGACVTSQLINCSRNISKTKYIAQHLVSKLALELNVMDGENRLNVVDLRDALILLTQKYGCQCRLPVIAVQNVAGELWDVCNQLTQSLGEERIALSIIKVAIETITSKVRLVIYKVKINAFMNQMPQPTILKAPRKRHLKLVDLLHPLFPLGLNGAVEWRNNRHSCSYFFKCLWQ